MSPRPVPPGPVPPRYRAAVPSDADQIAALHADSWRRNYRGAYLDSYLDGDVFADRVSVWTSRLERPSPEDRTFVGELDATVVGFAHVILDHDPEWGALLENLHVAHGHKGHGIGTGLMARAAHAVLRHASPTGLYLRVLVQNTAAQAFYRSRGGVCVGERMGGPFPGGGTAPVFLYGWPDPAALVSS